MDSDHYEPAQKVYISEKFAHDLAAMSLNHKDDRIGDSTPRVQLPSDSKQSVVVIDDINDFLSDEDTDGMETDYALPMQKRPGERKYHIPDFVLQNPRA
jgi:hypothetical protein